MIGLIDLRPVALVTGVLLMALGFSMLLPALIDAIVGSSDWQVFVSAATLTILVGLVLFVSTRGIPRGLSTRQALLMTACSWLGLVAFGALPFVWSGVVDNYTDAFFESMSGLTTTGATVITGLENAPPGILFWRGLLQWLGGLGIIVMAIAVFPMLQIGGMQLFKAEAFDTAEKILPRTTQISSSITLVFMGITVLCAVLYVAAGMAIDDAVIHAMTTVATGGFSTKDASFAYFDSAAIDMVAVVFMMAGSIPFILYVQMMQGRIRPIVTDQQVRVFLMFVLACIFLGWIMADASDLHQGSDGLRYAAFNVVSIITGTGYSSTDYGAWGSYAVVFFFLIMFVGGCAGSTSCGVKIFRFQVLFQAVKQHLNQVMYPNGIFRPEFNGRPIQPQIIASVMAFFFLFIASFLLLTLALRLLGLDSVTALSGAGSALANVGPGLGDVIGPTGNYAELNAGAKWILSFGMLLGRLELFTLMVLFLPSFWRT